MGIANLDRQVRERLMGKLLAIIEQEDAANESEPS
jgi:hypothetical protein